MTPVLVNPFRFNPPPAGGTDFKMGISRTALPTVSGNFNLTASADLGGDTPDCMLLLISFATADATVTDDVMLSASLIDANNQKCLCITIEDAQETTDVGSRGEAVAFSLTETAGDETETARGTFVNFIADGVTLNIAGGNEPTSAYLATAIFFSGLTNTHVEEFATTNTTIDTSESFTNAGFAPDIAITLFRGGASWVGTGSSFITLNMGVWAYDGTTETQACSVFSSRGGQTAGRDRNAVFTNRAAMFDREDRDQARFEFAQNANGIDATLRDTTIAAGNNYVVLLIKLPAGAGAVAGSILSPTSTGNQTTSGLSITPKGVLFGGTRAAVVNTIYTSTPNTGGISHGAMTANAEFQVGGHDDDGAGTTDAASYTSANAIHMLNEAPGSGDEYSYNFVSFGAGQFVGNWDVVDATNQFLSWFLAIGDLD